MGAREQAVEFAVSLNGKRSEVVDIYNAMPMRPLPRHYRVKYEDLLCATYVSAVFIHFGADWLKIVPPECAAFQLYRNMEAIGRATDNVKRVPEPGDIIFFGRGQKPSGINHVGIVTDIINGGKRIVYYDIYTSGRVGRHYAPIGYDWICGYAMPDYASIDGYESQPKPKDKADATPLPGKLGEFKAGDLVTVNPGAKWYRGSSIKLSVFSDQWYIMQVKGDRAVLGMNLAETRNICSPIHTSDISLVVANNAIEQPKEDKVNITVSVEKETLELLDIMATGWNLSIGEVIDKLMEDAR